MSAILSADDLNDFISPGLACIKPVETLPLQTPAALPLNPYEVTTEDQLALSTASAAPTTAQISLTDCLACSGCVTSAEAVLISLQSHQEVLGMLEKYRSVAIAEMLDEGIGGEEAEGKVFVASVSPQVRASLAVTYGVSEREAGWMVEQLLSGPSGLREGGRYGSGFSWVVDTSTVREICQDAVVEELRSVVSSTTATTVTTHHHTNAINSRPNLPILASACPGWICYAEKTHPHVLPHLSRLKSPQAMAGTLLKSVLSKKFGVPPDRIWHLAIMPCFDKKLEASREELTDVYWAPDAGKERTGIRDVDCVITARELLMLADTRGISFPRLPRKPLTPEPFPDATLDSFLFPKRGARIAQRNEIESGPSGGYAHHIVKAQQARTPGSTIRIDRGRNPDVVEYTLVQSDGQTVLKTARYFGFRNIQNLVRKLKPQKKSRLPGARLGGAENRRAKPGLPGSTVAAAGGGLGEYAYVEVMACPGGCTNGGGQIKVDDVSSLLGNPEPNAKMGPAEQKEWLARVDEAYYSADSSSSSPPSSDDDDDNNNDGNRNHIETSLSTTTPVDRTPDTSTPQSASKPYTKTKIETIIHHWSSVTGIEAEKLLFTTYRQVESDVGKERNGTAVSDVERVAGLAGSVGGGW